MILSSFRPFHDKSGLGYNKAYRRNSARYAFIYNKKINVNTKFPKNSIQNL